MVIKFNITNDNIEWSQYTWNPVTGCLGGCSYCYARDIANGLYIEKFEPTLRPDRLEGPIPKPPKDPSHRHVFVCSMADLFGDWVPQEWINKVLDVVRRSPEWTYLFLTKNPKRLMGIKFPKNAWVGTTVDVQTRVLPAEETFKQIKASVKFLSCEPLQESLVFSDLSMFDWMIIGGRSEVRGVCSEFKPPLPWVASLMGQAEDAGLKIFMKPNLGVSEAVRLKEYPVTEVINPLERWIGA